MPTLYFILGCTACGKGAIGRSLARRIGGQIVSVDSMKVYRRMDIGTAKPSPEARAEVPHHCIDVAEPSRGFSVAEYLDCADQAVARIRSAGAIPLAVGGTSLYIQALAFGLFAGPSADPTIRTELRGRARREGVEALHAELARIDPEAASRIHRNDLKRIIRGLEVHRLTGRAISELQRQWGGPARRYECVFLGLRRERTDLHHRINARARRMVEAGLREEVAALLAEPDGLSPQAAAAVGYAEMIAHLRGRLSLTDAVEQIKIRTRRLAKKQRTWRRRFPGVRWFDLAADTSPEQAAERIACEVSFQ